MMHKKNQEALGFLIQQGNPLILLTKKEAETSLTLMLYLKDQVENTGHPFKENMIHHGFSLFLLELAAVAKNIEEMKNM